MQGFDSYKKLFEKSFLEYLPERVNYSSRIIDAMEYSLESGGKRIRPVMLLAAAELVGISADSAMPFAAAIEFIHTYSLIHDDLPAMDNDDYRRGNLTSHKKFGEDIAILAGDALLNTACEIMVSECLSKVGPDLSNKLSATKTIMEAAGAKGMIAGQVADVLNQGSKASIDLIEYIEANKTGKLLTASIIAGLELGAASSDMTHDFTRFSDAFGLAFQISDDILDIVGTKGELGKSVGKDEAEDKCNFALVYGLEKAKSRLNELVLGSNQIIEKYGAGAKIFIDLNNALLNRRA